MLKKTQKKKPRQPKPPTQKQIRYNLHHQIRTQGYRLETRKKTIYVPFNYDPMSLSAQVERLRSEFQYALQTEIPQEKQPDPFITN